MQSAAATIGGIAGPSEGVLDAASLAGVEMTTVQPAGRHLVSRRSRCGHCQVNCGWWLRERQAKLTG
jgi:hypothetical protein